MRVAGPIRRFRTANEIHIPVGVPVLVRLHGGDVIHSFWVPQLAGKTDTIPGQTNLTWIQADAPGRYRGQCAEYCGAAARPMALRGRRRAAARISTRWRARAAQPAPPPATPAQTRGLALVEYRCGMCHAVRGTPAGARSAPDLTHLMSRAHDRRGHAAQQSRQPRRLDRESAGDQARRPHAATSICPAQQLDRRHAPIWRR